MNEAETRAEHIDPALAQAGWGVVPDSRVRRELILSSGRLIAGGGREQGSRADYALEYRNRVLAVVEAKAWGEPHTQGVAQAKIDGIKLSARFAYSTNGQRIYEVDLGNARECDVPRFPTPDELWNRVFELDNDWRNRFASVPLETKGGTWDDRYYQEVAVNRVTDAIAAQRDRILLTLATGTGKTFIAFQIAWKLYQSRWNLQRSGERRPRILFLADRNILADQAFNAFGAFPEDALIRIKPGEVKKDGRVPTNANLFFTIFQTFMSGQNADGSPQPYFGQYPPDFFDFIVIDECHRGGAQDESQWRGILNYFAPAVQLGLTATPKRDVNADTYRYFGEPVYVYSLKQGINDGYLTPFRVIAYATSLDDYTYTPDDIVLEGDVDPRRRYEEGDFNRIIVIDERERHRVRLLLRSLPTHEKALVFCANQRHALLVRDLINQLKDSTHVDYCHRVTADDGDIGERHLRQFQDNEKLIPTVLTTSHKLSTGVDARNVRHIVLMRPITSMIEFKQIIGRGTRLFEGKHYFTIHDFVKAHHHFHDAEWDGEPLPPESPAPPSPPRPPVSPPPAPPEPPEPPTRVRIQLRDGKERLIQHLTATMFVAPDGTLLSVEQFLQRLFDTALPELFKTEEELRAVWAVPSTRQLLLTRLADAGFSRHDLETVQSLINAERSDIYDVLQYIAFARPPISREQRVQRTRDAIIESVDDAQRQFIDFVLMHYVISGVDELQPEKLPELVKLMYHTLPEGLMALGGAERTRQTFISFQQHLYESAPSLDPGTTDTTLSA